MVGIRLVIVGLMLFFAPFSLAQNLQFDSDVSTALKQQVLNDLEWLAGVEGEQATPLHQEIFGPIHGSGYAQWFARRVFFFGVDGCGGSSAVACVKSKYKNKVFVTDHYIGGNFPQVARLMTLYHEARHTETENGMWSHSKCPRNFAYRSIWTGARLRNKSACDPSEYGSYAAASILLNNLAKFCTNCNEKIRSDAQTFANDQVKRVVGAVPAARVKADFQY